MLAAILAPTNFTLVILIWTSCAATAPFTYDVSATAEREPATPVCVCVCVCVCISLCLSSAASLCLKCRGRKRRVCVGRAEKPRLGGESLTLELSHAPLTHTHTHSLSHRSQRHRGNLC